MAKCGAPKRVRLAKVCACIKLNRMTKLCIIIPAYNEQTRITKTLHEYHSYFSAQQELETELLVVLNGCKDATAQVVAQAQQQLPNLRMIELKEAGKGLAIAAGFANAIDRSYDLIGFVDADMATRPEHFHALIKNMNSHDGAIASRYMAGAQVYPPRPWVKEWGRKIVYHGLIRLLFNLWYKDLQCGAKVFRRSVIQAIVPHMTVQQWAFDVELLYLCKKNKFKIKEVPTVWHDQAESKLLVMRSGIRMLGSLFAVRVRHSPFRSYYANKKRVAH